MKLFEVELLEMKVSASVRQIFDDQKSKYERLKIAVDTRIAGVKQPRWHYESRVKEITSFALKLESGRFRDPSSLEDFFACTLVVANLAEVAQAEALVKQSFELLERRPPRPDETHKAPDAFPFDDLRLYVAMPKTETMPPTDLDGVRFELQVKTFLQHAWSIATHDLIYKSDDPSWSKERIAFQTKALLEHAEMSISEAERLSASPALNKQDRRTSDLKSCIAIVREQWQPDDLPDDVRRLASNILALVTALKIDLERLRTLLDHGKEARSGAHPTNLSPFGTIVQYIFATNEKAQLVTLLENANSRTPQVLIPSEVDIPNDVDKTRLRNAIFVN